MTALFLVLATLLPSAQSAAGAAPELRAAERYGPPVATPDGTRVVSLADSFAWLLDAETGEALLGVQAGAAHCAYERWKGAQFSLDGKRLVLWGRRAGLALVDVEHNALLWRVQPFDRDGLGTIQVSGDLATLVQHNWDTLSTMILSDKGPRRESTIRLGSSKQTRPATLSFALSADGKQLFDMGKWNVRRYPVEGGELGEHTSFATDSWKGIALVESLNSALLVRANSVHRYDLAKAEEVVRADLSDDYWGIAATDVRGRVAILSDADEGLIAVDPVDLKTLWRMPHGYDPVIHPRSGTVIARVRYGKQHEVLDLLSGELLWKLDHRYIVWRGAAELGEEQLMLAHLDNHGLTRFDAREGTVLGGLLPEEGATTHVGMLDAKTAWTLGQDGSLQTLDAADGQVVATQTIPGANTAASTANRIVVLTEEGPAHAFEGPTLKPIGEFPAGTELAISRDTKLVLTWGTRVRGARVHALPGGKVVRELVGDAFQFDHATWDATGQVLAGLDRDGNPTLARNGEQVKLARIGGAQSIALDPLGRWLALGGKQSNVHLFDATTGARARTLDIKLWVDPLENVRNVEFDPEGRYLIATTAGMHAVQVWSTESWEVLWQHDYQSGNPSRLRTKVESGSKRLWVSGSAAADVPCFDLATGNPLLSLGDKGYGELFPAPGGQAIATLQGGALVVLDGDGVAMMRRLDLGKAVAIITTRDGRIAGDARALRRVFIQSGNRFLRADSLPESR